MSSNFGYYIFIIVAIIVGFLVFKKVTGCIIKLVLTAIVVSVLAAIYYLYLK
ncbi:MAG: hypothetical protein U0K29_00100 [Prevotella sp.]|nr:hypothetical protein [Prevotella sp.]